MKEEHNMYTLIDTKQKPQAMPAAFVLYLIAGCTSLAAVVADERLRAKAAHALSLQIGIHRAHPLEHRQCALLLGYSHNPR